MSTMEWDDPTKVAAEFPQDQYEYIPVRSPEDARAAIATRIWHTREPMIGEARWYGPQKGVLILKKEKPKAPETKSPTVVADPTWVPWWRRWWPF